MARLFEMVGPATVADHGGRGSRRSKRRLSTTGSNTGTGSASKAPMTEATEGTGH